MIRSPDAGCSSEGRFRADATRARNGPEPTRRPDRVRRLAQVGGMAERAAELGGTCSVSARDEGGTAVVAVLPLRAAS